MQQLPRLGSCANDGVPPLVSLCRVAVLMTVFLLSCLCAGVARAAAVLLSDPCFQLHSIQHLLGESELLSSFRAAPPSAERKHFSLNTYTDYISPEEQQKVERMLSFLTNESKEAAASAASSLMYCSHDVRSLLWCEVCSWLIDLLRKLDFGISNMALDSMEVWNRPGDTDYISPEEQQKVERMLSFLTNESKEAAASAAVSPDHTLHMSECCVLYSHERVLYTLLTWASAVYSTHMGECCVLYSHGRVLCTLLT
ncbi:UNVERIFIED_CONTAM: hypothetical protein FKN15_057400 [Acipenser sinensis]